MLIIKSVDTINNVYIMFKLKFVSPFYDFYLADRSDRCSAVGGHDGGVFSSSIRKDIIAKWPCSYSIFLLITSYMFMLSFLSCPLLLVSS